MYKSTEYRHNICRVGWQQWKVSLDIVWSYVLYCTNSAPCWGPDLSEVLIYPRPYGGCLMIWASLKWEIPLNLYNWKIHWDVCSRSLWRGNSDLKKIKRRGFKNDLSLLLMKQKSINVAFPYDKVICNIHCGFTQLGQ